MPETTNSPPRCHIPWQEMNIDADGNVTPCCNWLSHGNTDNPYCGNAKTQSLLEIWNGEVYQRLRKYMALGDYEKSGCAKCTLILRGEKSPLRYDPEADAEIAAAAGSDELTPYARNLQILREEIAQGSTVLKAMPTVVSAVPSYSCNLRCLHCYQEPVRTKDLDRPTLLDEIRQLLPTLSLINCGGGEPLVLPVWRDFLEGLDLSGNPYLTMGTCTNATVLTDRALRAIDQFKNLHIGVSVDAGSKEVYERVRVNGTFKVVSGNIDKLLTLVRARPNSYLSVSMSVMRDNLQDMGNFIEFATSKGVTFSLSPVISMPQDEALTCYNDALTELRQWDAALNHAAELIEQLDFAYITGDPDSLRNNYRHQLAFVRDQISWDLADQPTFLVEGDVFPELLNKSGGLRRETDKLLLFWPEANNRPTTARYFSRIIDGRFSVRLPAGAYFLGIVPRFGWPVFDLDWLIDVVPGGRIIRRPKGRFIESTQEFVAAISSGDLPPYAADFVLEENTNAWNSTQTGAAVAGAAYIGVDFLAPRRVGGAKVRWVLPYATPRRIAVQFSDDGDEWTTAAEMTVGDRPEEASFWWEAFDVVEEVAHRWWRLLALTATPGNGSFAIAELQFFKPRDEKPREATPARKPEAPAWWKRMFASVP